MRKFFVILAFLAFTQNVKAEVIDFGDVQAIGGVTPTEFLTEYIITGGEFRIYWDSIPDGLMPAGQYNHIKQIFRSLVGVTRDSDGDLITASYDMCAGVTDGYKDIVQKMADSSYNFTWNHGVINDKTFPAIGLSKSGSSDISFTGYDNFGGAYFTTSDLAYKASNAADAITTTYVLTNTVFNDSAAYRSLAAQNMATLTDGLSYFQSIPINGLQIDVNGGGSCSNCVMLLGSILTNLTTYTDYMFNVATNRTGSFAYYLNDQSFDDKWVAITNMYAQQGLGGTGDFDYYQRMEMLLAALVYKPNAHIDYTDYFNVISAFGGDTTNTTRFLNLMRARFLGTSGNLGVISGKGATRRLLFGDWYDFVDGKYKSLINLDEYISTEDALTDIEKWNVLRYYNDTAWEFRRASYETNILDGVSLGRDWLTLATNDTSSLPYWLNQQDYSPVGGTNSVNLTRFDVITNQYAHIGLTGSGQQANSADTWNYFKRLEMLLAALVYKQTDYEGKIDRNEVGNNSSVASSVQQAEDQINTSLSSVRDALSINTLGNAKNTIVSLFQTATSAFDVNGSKRIINVMETDVASGNEGSAVTVNMDFTQGHLGDFADFVHHLFGFAWGFGSLFIFWRVCKFCWDMGYKVVKFHYSLCRKFLGI